MKEYKFNTKSGNHVTIQTNSGTEDYFEVYVTVPELDINNLRVYNISEDKMSFFSPKLCSPCVISLPVEIGKSIMADMTNACNNTGKIVVATLTYNDGTTRQYFGKAIAKISMLKNTYIMPDAMEHRIMSHSYNGKVYDYGGVEDECKSLESMLIFENIAHYWMPSIEHTEDWNALDSLLDPTKGIKEGAAIGIELKVITPIS